MLSNGIVLQLLIVVCLLTGRASSCDNDQASSCPHYALVSEVSIIPIPDPDHLDEMCSKLQEGLRCLLRSSRLGYCNALTKAVYTSILNVLQYPCQRRRTEYLSGRECWKSRDLEGMLKRCYLLHSDAIRADYCSGHKEFVHCAINNVTTVPHCGETERRVLTVMVITNYNDYGLVMKPPCHELTTSQPETTTTTTTTTTTPTTTTTTTTTSPKTQTSTRREASTRSSSKSMTTTTSRSVQQEPTASSESTTGDNMMVMTQASRSGADRTVFRGPTTAWGAVLCLSLMHLVGHVAFP